jgi:hypothetical protein
MKFIKDLVRNMVLLSIVFAAIYLLFPDLMRGVFQVWDGLFGPGLILLALVISALPRERK